MKNFIGFIVVSLPLALSAQTYSVASIPDSLKKNADVVKRNEEITIEIKSPAKALINTRIAYTVLNEDGNEHGDYIAYYDKFVSVNSVSGTLYDQNGKEIKHVKKKDMQDFSGTGDENLITDARYKINRFYYRVYPYTVQYEEEDEINGIRNFEDWIPQNAHRMAVQQSKYVIIAPKNYMIRYKEFNFSQPPVITENGDKRTYTWQISNLPAKLTESLAPSFVTLTPHVLIAPSDFEAEGYAGNMSTWKNFGAFFYQLTKSRDALPDNVKKEVHELTDNLKTQKEKIAALYNYLQKNTRYVSIQFGIGGWQPFDATYVSTKKYGDCKALSNFMVALLKEAGIDGKYVIIRAGKNAQQIVSDFSESQFNHVICCVPLLKDTVWLECTDHELPAGYLSSFTADRWGLLVDQSGGTLVHTPKYGVNDNLQIRRISATLNGDGNLSAFINTNYKAEQQDELEMDLEYRSKDELLKKLKSEIDLPTYDVTKFDYKEQKNNIPPSIDESIELTANNYAQVSGKRLFINPNILNRSETKLKTEEERKYPIELRSEYKDVDTVEIKVPSGYQPEAFPADTKIESKFGKYFCSVKITADKILYYRYREQYSGEFPAADYTDLVNYYDKIYKSDRSKIVLVKKE